MITSITSASALLRWSAPTFPNGIILLYSITLVAVDEASVVRLLNSTTDGVDILLDSLDPFTRYSVTLYASNSIMGEASEPTQFTTQEDGKYAVAYSYHDPLPIFKISKSPTSNTLAVLFMTF